MARPAALFALASGRLTPLTRIALLAGLGALFALVVLFEPVHSGAPRAVAGPAFTQVLDPRSAWAERASLQDGGAWLLSLPAESTRPADVAQPDAAPFTAYGPELSQDPAKPLVLPDQSPTTPWKNLEAAFPWHGDNPYQTLGQRPGLDARLTARMLKVEVYSDKNEFVFSREFRSGEDSLKHLDKSVLNLVVPVEIRVGIDGFGIQSNPYLLRSSGDRQADQSVLDWSRQFAWARWLKPGSYRVVIGP